MSLVVYFSIWDDMAHNPNINRREHFCPCGCNANCQYTSVSGEPATHERPNSEAAWNNWWTCKDSWEEPNLSRAFPGLVWTAIEQVKLFTTLNRRVERTLVRRMLPQYKKSTPRLVVGSLEPHLWVTWVRCISNGAPYLEVKQRTLRVGSYLPNKQKVVFTRVIWKTFMPRLSTMRTHWWRTKWVDENGTLFRAEITKLSFGYNPMTETITAGLDYRTEFYCDEESKWKLLCN